MIASALKHQSGVGSQALSFCDSSKLPVTKKGVEELSSSDWPSEPASFRTVLRHWFGDGPVAQGSTCELGAESSRQLGSTKNGLAYAAMLARQTSPQQPNGLYKPPGMDPDHSEPAATRHMLHMSGLLCGMPDGNSLGGRAAT